MELIQSPLNYTGGKYKLLKQILPLFPTNIHTFVDLFCGGANVAANIEAKYTIINDLDRNVILLLQAFRNLDKDAIFEYINNIIAKYNLSDSDKNGYKFYDCSSDKGLGPYNKLAFNALREDFNNNRTYDYYYYLCLYVLIIYSFNNQIRFNNKGEFNLPVGKRDFNSKMKSKLEHFIDRLKYINCKFLNIDFADFDYSDLNNNDLVYIDPPYLITCATYNENNGWNEQKEHLLYDFINALNDNNIRFALSNVTVSKDRTNHILLDWINRHSYNCHHLNYNYSNSNYHIHNKKSRTDEVLITNF